MAVIFSVFALAGALSSCGSKVDEAQTEAFRPPVTLFWATAVPTSLRLKKVTVTPPVGTPKTTLVLEIGVTNKGNADLVRKCILCKQLSATVFIDYIKMDALLWSQNSTYPGYSGPGTGGVTIKPNETKFFTLGALDDVNKPTIEACKKYSVLLDGLSFGQYPDVASQRALNGTVMLQLFDPTSTPCVSPFPGGPG
jgi:hypothetical protein